MANPAPGYQKNPDHHIRLEASPRRVRVQFAGEWIADSTDMMLMYEANHLPVYYFPVKDVRLDLLHPTDHTSHCPYKGDASYWSIEAGGQVSENAVWAYQTPFDEMSAINTFRITAPSTGNGSITGSKRTRKSSCTPVIPINASTRYLQRAQ